MSMSHGYFDENNWESWYFESLTKEQSTKLLQYQDIGVFLIRDSSSIQGGYVVCVKERDDVAQYAINWKLVDDGRQYYIREESSFRDVPALLSFYKRNLFRTTPLVRPLNKDNDALIQMRKHLNGNRISELVGGNKLDSPSDSPNSQRKSAPGTIGDHKRLLDDDEQPRYAVVTKMNIPSPYNNRALTLTVGDIIQVTKRCQSGQWEGEINGKKGVFPFTHVEMLPEGQTQL